MLYPQKYVPVVTVIKGIVGGIGAGSVGVIIIWLIDALTTGNFEMNEAQTAAIVAVAGAVWIAAKNFAKVKLGWNWLPVLVCAIALQGCAGVGLPNTLSKPVEHETKLNITQPPTVNPDGTVVAGETTEYYKKWKGGAGVESTKSDNLRMGIDKDGNWYVEQGEASQLSTQGQVQGIVDGMKLNLEAIMAGYALGSQGINVAAPLIGQKLQFDADDKARDDANSAARDQQVLQFLEQLSKRLSKIEAAQKPATPPADAPLIDLPTVGEN